MKYAKQQTILSIAMLSMLSAVVHAANSTFVGYAYDAASNQLVYSEVHQERMDAKGGVELSTTYLDPDGETIAVRSVDFSTDPLAPQFQFEDVRNGYSEGMRYEDDDIVVFHQPPERSKGVKEKQLVRPDLLVADAGFDRLVTTYWDQLVSGEKMAASFLVPSRLRCLKFSFQRLGESMIDDEPVVTFKMEFKNPLLRVLAGSIRVTYHREHRILMRYEGLSNLSDPSGGNYDVRIEFPLSERSDWVEEERPDRRVASNG